MRFIVCSASRGQYCAGFTRGLAKLALMLSQRGVDFDPFNDHWEDKMPGALFHARNCLLYRIAEELEDEDVVWWQDSDVTIAPTFILGDLLSRDEEIISRAYPLKAAQGLHQAWSAMPLRQGLRTLTWSEDGRLLECAGFGFGAVQMRPSAARKMRDKYGVVGKGGKGARTIPAFDFRVNHWNTLCPEDVSFCDRWREEMGLRLWCAPDAYVCNGEIGGDYYVDVLKPQGLTPDNSR